MATVETSVTVTAPWLSKGVTLQSWVQKGESKFCRICKSDALIVRLLTGHGIGTARQLARTNVIEHLLRLREKKRADACESAEKAESSKAEDLGIDAPLPKRKKAALSSVLPDIVTIDSPPIHGVGGITMKVLLGDHPLAPLFVELTSENIDYLHAYAQAQIDEGTVHCPTPGSGKPQENKIEPPATGVIWSFERGAFRARYLDEFGRKRTRDFRPENDEQPSSSTAADAAAMFVASQKK